MNKENFLSSLPSRLREALNDRSQMQDLTTEEFLELKDRVRHATSSGTMTRRDFLWLAAAMGFGSSFFANDASASPFFNVGAFWRKRSALGSQQTYVDDVFSAWTYTGNGAQQEIRNGIRLADSTVSQCFATNLYSGNGSNQKITNNIDLANKGGLVWVKGRSFSSPHYFRDSLRGESVLSSNTTGQETAFSGFTFGSDGYSLSNIGDANNSGGSFASWTFAQQSNFFQVRTFSHTNGTATNISVSELGTIGFAIIKARNLTSAWWLWHRSMSPGNNSRLNTRADMTSTDAWISVSGTTITWSASAPTGNYVLYGWAHDTSSVGIVRCDSYTGSGVLNPSRQSVSVGFRPQFVLVGLMTGGSGSHASPVIIDSARGGSANNLNYLEASQATSEQAGGYSFDLTSDGFSIGESAYSDSGRSYFYLAIRAPEVVSSINSGGLVWIKSRSQGSTGYEHILTDTARGTTSQLNSGSSNASTAYTNAITQFNASGFTVTSRTPVNASPESYVSWTFRNQPNFFYCTTYTGNGVAGRVIPLPTGWTQVPGCIIVKRTDNTGEWWVWHRSATNTSGVPGEGGSAYSFLQLNSTAASNRTTVVWNGTNPTSSGITVGSHASSNESGAGYVMYVFGHDTSANGMIQCGSYTGNGSVAGPVVNLGWEPQWLLTKDSSGTNNWFIFDQARGFTTGTTNDGLIQANNGSQELSSNRFEPLSNGFAPTSTNPDVNNSGSIYIYIAIRRPNKPATSGAQVFDTIARTGTGAAQSITGLAFSPDVWFCKNRNSTQNNWVFDKLRGPNQVLSSNLNDSESGNTTTYFGGSPIFTPTSTGFNTISQAQINTSSNTYADWLFRRAPGVFDQVCYTGTGSARTIAHNLGSAPTMMWVKSRSASGYNWDVYHSLLGASGRANLNNTNAASSGYSGWNSVSPTSTGFSLNGGAGNNDSGVTYVAYLFGNTPGICGTFSYSGSGSAVTVNLGFNPRFIIIKRSDSTGGWYVFDTVRGIVSANDPMLQFNSTSAEVTSSDYIDPTSNGFIVNNVTAELNTSGGTYIGWAIS